MSYVAGYSSVCNCCTLYHHSVCSCGSFCHLTTPSHAANLSHMSQVKPISLKTNQASNPHDKRVLLTFALCSLGPRLNQPQCRSLSGVSLCSCHTPIDALSQQSNSGSISEIEEVNVNYDLQNLKNRLCGNEKS